ncbi:hypothetical protein JW968_02865 [Candidatus Woesearchaeota archaeon]|nr:hypothetical protein [Candidatus Woesearchaeota archaeon]
MIKRIEDQVIIRYGEIGIKGQNRGWFESRLVQNIRDFASRNEIDCWIRRTRGRILLSMHEGVEMPDISGLKRVFGISSFSKAVACRADISDISRETERFYGKIKGKSFRVTAKRLDKGFKPDSIELERVIGQQIVEATGAKVDLKRHDTEIGIEITKENAFIFDNTTRGYGGLPLGSEGECLVLMEDMQSCVAAWLMMKRGAEIEVVTMDGKHENAKFISHLEKFDYGSKIGRHCTEDIKGLMEETGHEALVRGDTRVPKVQDEVFTLRPLLGWSEDEIFRAYHEIEGAR